MKHPFTKLAKAIRPTQDTLIQQNHIICSLLNANKKDLIICSLLFTCFLFIPFIWQWISPSPFKISNLSFGKIILAIPILGYLYILIITGNQIRKLKQWKIILVNLFFKIFDLKGEITILLVHIDNLPEGHEDLAALQDQLSQSQTALQTVLSKARALLEAERIE